MRSKAIQGLLAILLTASVCLALFLPLNAEAAVEDEVIFV